MRYEAPELRASLSSPNKAAWSALYTLGPLVPTLWFWFEWMQRGVWLFRNTVGLAIMVPSSILWALARRQLGASFATRAGAKMLVTRGLYSRMRNPIYVFGELTSFGLFVFLGVPLLFLTFGLSIPIQVIRARREAAVLESAFGEEYREYRARTWL